MLLLARPGGGLARRRGRRTRRGGTAVRRIGPRPCGPVFKRANPGAEVRQLLADVVVEAPLTFVSRFASCWWKVLPRE
eukprot:2781722-Alexandrium_andersonii.AAC.1